MSNDVNTPASIIAGDIGGKDRTRGSSQTPPRRLRRAVARRSAPIRKIAPPSAGAGRRRPDSGRVIRASSGSLASIGPTGPSARVRDENRNSRKVRANDPGCGVRRRRRVREPFGGTAAKRRRRQRRRIGRVIGVEPGPLDARDVGKPGHRLGIFVVFDEGGKIAAVFEQQRRRRRRRRGYGNAPSRGRTRRR